MRRRTMVSGGIDYSKQYLTFVSLADNNEITFSVTSATNISPINIYVFKGVNPNPYSGWSIKTATEAGTVLSTLNRGEKLYIRITNYATLPTSYSDATDYHYFSSTGDFALEGNIMSLLYHLRYDEQTSLPSGTYTFLRMFAGCTGLVDIDNLVMPATTLVQGCYERMFQETGITSLPENLLPATTCAQSCYYNMFRNCTGLTEIPSGLLPATTLATYCYGYMFYGTSITSLSSTLLPATTMADHCYYFMFGYCKGIKTLPSNFLHATTLAQYCYGEMFDRAGLTSLPSGLLQATTLKDYCYYAMFYYCTDLTNVPSDLLPATTLVRYCYNAMFGGCTSLTTAPVLPAKSLVSNCYRTMFNGCTSLNYIKAMFTTKPSSSYTYNWVSNVASAGTFVKNSAATWSVTGAHGVPSGWTIQKASS